MISSPDTRNIHRRPDTNRVLPNREMLVTVGYSELPPNAVDHFIENDELKSELPPEFHYLLDPAFLRKHLYFTAPLETAEHQKLVSHESGRSLEKILGGAFVPLANKFIATNVDLKGAFRSGALYQRETLNTDRQDTPLGFIDKKHILHVKNISNQLLKAGFRTAAFLGGAVLKKDIVLNWLADQNLPDAILARAQHDLNEMSGQPAVYWRLGGVSTRWTREIHGVHYDETFESQESPFGQQYFRNSFARAARLFLEEWRVFLDQAKKYPSSAGDNIQTVRTLTDIALRKTITQEQLDTFKSYYAGMLIDNVIALRHLFKNGTDIVRLQSIAQPGDIDLSLFVYDLELSTTAKYRDNGQPIIEKSEYPLDKAEKYVDELASNLDYCLDKYSKLLGVVNDSKGTTVRGEANRRLDEMFN